MIKRSQPSRTANQFIVSGFAGRAFGDERDDGGPTFGAAFDYLASAAA